MKSPAVRIAVSLVLMVALLALFLWNVDFDEMMASLAQANPWLIALAALLALVSYFARVVSERGEDAAGGTGAAAEHHACSPAYGRGYI